MASNNSLDTLMTELRAAGVNLWLEGDSLKLKYPKGALMPELTQRIKDNKASIVDYLRDPYYPMASPQLKIWVSCALNPDSAAYNIPSRYLMKGLPDLRVYERAVGAVVSRHEILRTLFRTVNGSPVQIVKPPDHKNITIGYTDLRTDPDREAHADQAMLADARKPFLLDELPLFRIDIFHLEDEEYILYVNIHHIICDGWSMDVLTRDLVRYFETYAAGLVPDMPPLQQQYKDFAIWQQTMLDSEQGKASRSYWLQKLSGDLPVLSLPSYRPRPSAMSGNGYKLIAQIDPVLTGKLAAFSVANQGTLFMGLVTVFKTLLYRYTGLQDLVIGTPLAFRHLAGLEDQIGYYVNTVALRTIFSGSDSFIRMFDRVREEVLSTYEFQLYPFDKVEEELGRRDRSRAPVYDIILVLQNHSYRISPENDLTDTEEMVDAGPGPVKFDLVVTFSEGADGLRMNVEFSTDIYDKEMIRSFIHHFKRLLHLAMADPDQAIQQYEYLLPGERKMLLGDLNATLAEYPQVTISDMFRQQVLERGDAAAVVFEGETLSYAQLDEKSNQLARYLQKKGVARGMLVPICLDRSLEMIISIFGVIKAGAAYVPIDPTYPTDRIRYMIGDTRAKHIITHTFYKDLFGSAPQAFRVYVDRDGMAMEMEAATPLPTAGDAGDLVYVIYTSGSTGLPKGVMIEHKGLANLTMAMRDVLGLRAGAGFLQFASFSFDASCYEIFTTLLTGGYLVMASQDTVQSPAGLARLIGEHAVEVAVIPPSFQGLIKDAITKLKTVVSGAEPLNAEMGRSIQRAGVALFNAYGPTEATIAASIATEPIVEGNLITIGRPVSNMDLYVLDEGMQPVPAGVIGELYIGGVQLARGYLNREDLTASRFLPHPFRPGQRLYRSGDLARWLPCGQLEHMGRADDQVKIRGYRIELGEIEYSVSILPGVESCVAAVRQREGGESFIAAYFTSRGQPDRQQMKMRLSASLPEYMVPAWLVQLEALPRLPNGKIDRKALPDPVLTRTSDFIAPETPMQSRMVELVASILDCEPGRIGITDNFFETGMNSLFLIRTCEAFNTEFNLQLKVSMFFEHPTIQQLSNICSTSPGEGAVPARQPEREENFDDVLNLFEHE